MAAASDQLLRHVVVNSPLGLQPWLCWAMYGDSTLLQVGGLQALRHEGDLHALLHGSGLQPLSSASLTSVSTTQGAPDAKVTKDHEDKREQERYGGREKEKKKRLRKNTSSSR